MSSSEVRGARVRDARVLDARGVRGARARAAGVDRGAPDGRDAGFVTAEAAVVLPALVLFAMGLLWALLAAGAQIQCIDAARAGARAAARQDPYDAAVAAAEQAAPKGARVTLRREGDLVRVRVEADTPGPALLALHLHQEAVAMAEETVGDSGAADDGAHAAADGTQPHVAAKAHVGTVTGDLGTVTGGLGTAAVDRNRPTASGGG